jgi:SAM-dependent methyltransferase
MTREEKILAQIQPQFQRGIEIGPLNQPIVARNMGFVRYVDHATTEELRTKCAQRGTIDISTIVDVDYVWGDRDLKELTKGEAPFDYVIASHVIEHVPDLIGWLKEIRSVLKTGGVLSLAIPDKRFTYDFFRQTTKPGDVIDALLRHARKPSPRQVFDYHSEFVRRNGDFAWRVYGLEKELVHEHSLEKSLQITQDAFRNDQYVDVHCWVFTELSFLKLLKDLAQLDLIDFKIARFFGRTKHEFYVSLEAIDPNLDQSNRQRLLLESISGIEKKFQKLYLQPIFDPLSWQIVHRFRLIPALKKLKRIFTRIV